MCELPPSVFDHEQKRAPSNIAWRLAEHERYDTGGSIHFGSQAPRLKVQIRRSLPPFCYIIEELAKTDRHCDAINAFGSVGKRKKDRRIARPGCQEGFPVHVVKHAQEILGRNRE